MEAWAEMKTSIMAAVVVSFIAFPVSALETYSVAELFSRLGFTTMIVEAEAESAGMASKADAVSGLPDMGFGYELMDAPDPEMLTHRLSIRQELPLWGKRWLLRRSAEVETSFARAMIAERRNFIQQELHSSLNDYRFAESSKKVRQGELEAMKSIMESTKARYATGSAAISELYLLEIEIAELEGMIRAMEAMSEVALNRALDSVDLGFRDARLGPFLSRVTRLPSETDADTLFFAAKQYSPILAAAGEELRGTRLGIRLAEKALYPDLMLDLSYSYKPTAGLLGSFSLGFGLNLPVFSAGARKAEAAMASKQVEAAAARLAGTEDSLYRNIRMLLSETGSYARLIELYEKRIQPMRAADLEALLSAYAVGEASLGMTLDSVRRNYSARIGYLENHLSLIQGLLELEYLTGETFVIFEDGSME